MRSGDMARILLAEDDDNMRAFLTRHRKELSKERTVFVNVEEVGAGAVRIIADSRSSARWSALMEAMSL